MRYERKRERRTYGYEDDVINILFPFSENNIVRIEGVPYFEDTFDIRIVGVKKDEETECFFPHFGLVNLCEFVCKIMIIIRFIYVFVMTVNVG